MTRSKTDFMNAGELFVEIRRDSPLSVHRQLEMGIRDRIRQGLLPPGAVMPASRALAADLAVSRGVVVEAYQQLVAEGYLISRAGGYTQVATNARTDSQRAVRRSETAAQTTPRIDFRYGKPDVSQFPRSAWLRSLRRVMNEIPSDRLGYLDGRGAPELHTAIADYLNRVRGTAARPESVLVTNGFAQAIRLCAEVLVRRGITRLAVEDPSTDDDIRLLAPPLGLEVVGIPVLESGIDVAALERSGVDAVLVTAAHQFPTGVVLAPQSRKALVEWAVRRDGLIIEDDYDAEFRYDRDPIGAIQGLAPEQVVYAGSASKILAPGLRLGWLITPERLTADIASAKLTADRGSPVLEQLTFADFVSHGELDRHLRRMRPLYRRRRDVLLQSLRHHLPELELTGVAAGLHAVAWLPAGLDEASIVDAAAKLELGVYGLAPYWMRTGRPGLLFGYGGLSENAIAEGVQLLAQTIRGLTQVSGRGRRP